MKKIAIAALLLSFFCKIKGQDIEMEFPYFAGKTYDFILFQGSKTKVIHDTVPKDGKFTLSVPKEYSPYTGMVRWLITGTKEGGGLDMLIPGHNFSVICKEPKPDDSNIIYTGNKHIGELNILFKKQQTIFARHDAMLQATKAFSVGDKNYALYKKEYHNQLKAYDDFQKELKLKNDYPAQFITIVNITQGIGTQIFPTEKERAKNIAHYISQELDWETLYTSGHWDGIVASWVAIHTEVFNEPKGFASDFAQISKKLKGEQYTDFAARVAYTLSQNGKDNFIAEISPMVIASEKITSYIGPLAVYIAGTNGTQAPDLELSIGPSTTILQSKDFTKETRGKTLLLFYVSSCGPCKQVLDELSKEYTNIQALGIRVISISADEDEFLFTAKAKELPWKDKYRDNKGLKGINFKNYGVMGTPTLFLIDKSGKIVVRSATLKEIMSNL